MTKTNELVVQAYIPSVSTRSLILSERKLLQLILAALSLRKRPQVVMNLPVDQLHYKDIRHLVDPLNYSSTTSRPINRQYFNHQLQQE